MAKRRPWVILAIVLVIIWVCLVLAIRRSMFEAFRMRSSSMENTILYGDHILVRKMAYGLLNPLTERYIVKFATPSRKDLVVLRNPQHPEAKQFKRVIGLPGDKLEIRKTKVYINGKLLDEPYAVFKPEFEGLTAEDFGPVTVPQNACFVLGDNRDNSKDSRAFGSVTLDNVLGKATLVYWPVDPESHKVRPDRFMKRLQ